MSKTKKEPVETAEGNTIPPRQAKRWCFTLNNWNKGHLEEIIKKFKSNNAKYIIGEEIGETKTEHLQGYVEFDKKIRVFGLGETSGLGLSKKIHWEVAKGNQEDNIKYCSKDGKYHVEGFTIKKPLKLLKDESLLDWQKKIIDEIKTDADDRKIIWIYDELGGGGKTTFCKYMISKHGAVLLGGKLADCLYVAAENESDIYLINIPRTIEKYVSYTAIEAVKDGLYTSGKYESKSIIRNCPHVYIFANFLPNESSMSKDKWEIREIKSLINK